MLNTVSLWNTISVFFKFRIISDEINDDIFLLYLWRQIMIKDEIQDIR